MNRIDAIVFFIWLVAGILTLLNEDISKASYFVMWFAFMVKLFGAMFTV